MMDSVEWHRTRIGSTCIREGLRGVCLWTGRYWEASLSSGEALLSFGYHRGRSSAEIALELAFILETTVAGRSAQKGDPS